MRRTRLMKNLQEKQFKVIRVNKVEFELENGDVFPISFDLDEVPTVEEFQKILDESKELMIAVLGRRNA